MLLKTSKSSSEIY